MAKEELKQAIRDYHLLRTHSFPFLMPIIKAFEGEQEQLDLQLKTLISNHVFSKYEKITTTTGIAATKLEWKKAFWETVEIDFLKKGLVREKRALEELKTRYPEVLWTGDVSVKDENEGIDIKSEDGILGISVKGWNFQRGKSYLDHKTKLINNSFERTFIIFVDEKKDKLKMKEVK